MNPRTTTQFIGFNFGPRMGTRTGVNGSDGFNIHALLQFLPVIIILIFIFLPSNEPVCSLQRTFTYEIFFSDKDSHTCIYIHL